ncbi:MAG TPA: Rpn family recombination-promoting nuclease/putative transposase [Candidatus Mediterraneibacter faecavium]|uniref:Rpn family recombination-promoting nuclease/putative transposase n=1 Tax=Candidatus Mediterraneibacter faecavium TaxID=2838668 RepID=A0A9D2TM62_9FIRM|nr:Rpn family recombination-promoting nuclease/putative transposase [Candidatus Mediterraneibacter faecavium]
MEDTRKLNMRMKDAEDDVNPLQNMNLMDDFLFDVATVDLETCKIIIELSLGIMIKKIRWKEGQKVVHNMPGKRGIRMDFYVEDDKGQVFDVEMQKRNQGNIPKRTRFYQALIDTPMLKSGERGFDNLKPAYIIVICGFDQYGYGKYRYTFENRCKEIPDLTMGDECTKIILNTKGTNDDEVEKSLVDFLHYVDHSSEENVPDDCDERLKHLHKKIYEIKSNEQMGVSYMKMEERDRLLVETGEIMGIVSIVRKIMEKEESNDKVASILNNIGIEDQYIEKAIKAVTEYRDRSDQDIAEMILYNEV